MRTVKTLTQVRLGEIIKTSIAMLCMLYIVRGENSIFYICLTLMVIVLMLLIDTKVNISKTKQSTTQLKIEGTCVESEILKIYQSPYYFAKYITIKVECKSVIDDVEHIVNSKFFGIPLEIAENDMTAKVYFDKNDANNYLVEIDVLQG